MFFSAVAVLAIIIYGPHKRKRIVYQKSQAPADINVFKIDKKTLKQEKRIRKELELSILNVNSESIYAPSNNNGGQFDKLPGFVECVMHCIYAFSDELVMKIFEQMQGFEMARYEFRKPINIDLHLEWQEHVIVFID